MMTHISPEFARAYSLLRGNTEYWFSSKELAQHAGIAARTARHITRTMSQNGLLITRRLSPAFRFQASFEPTEHALPFLRALEEACEVYGINRALD
jgi:DNA-binding IclR family transcriptional regulator